MQYMIIWIVLHDSVSLFNYSPVLHKTCLLCVNVCYTGRFLRESPNMQVL